MAIEKDLQNIRRAVEEHLSAINENTEEIQSLFDYLNEAEMKMDKLSQRLDHLQLSLGQPMEKPGIAPLTHVERKVFLVLYTEETPLSQKEIVERSGFSADFVRECISSLIKKGVPLQRSFFNEQIFLRLNPQFKELQAKENLINLSLQSFME
ncbi:hypothetical protein HY495_02060 [Candidatus Woesearchaeota archaeon]|nr:hypothetical protein [Candidatus Woesearchaeota archaeon]